MAEHRPNKFIEWSFKADVAKASRKCHYCGMPILAGQSCLKIYQDHVWNVKWFESFNCCMFCIDSLNWNRCKKWKKGATYWVQEWADIYLMLNQVISASREVKGLWNISVTHTKSKVRKGKRV